MALRISDRFPEGNVRVLKVSRADNVVEVEFTPETRGSPRVTWFYFKMSEDNDKNKLPLPETLALTLCFADNIGHEDNTDACRPVFREIDKNWVRLKRPDKKLSDDGVLSLTWHVPYPAAPSEFAFCFPFGREELETLKRQSRGYWTERNIGITHSGRMLKRLNNSIYKGCDACSNPRGLFLVARENGGETPGSWVLDGMLDAISRAKPVNWCVWAIPFANLDDVCRGRYIADESFKEQKLNPKDKRPDLYETYIIKNDLQRWAKRCNPALVLSLCASPALDSAGVRLVDNLIQEGGTNSHTSENEAWINMFAQALNPEYGSEKFQADEKSSSCWLIPSLRSFLENEPKCGALTLEIHLHLPVKHYCCKSNIGKLENV
ncbi:MAG: hypothetical protein GX804_00175 [Lentisphaerae bacterium]|nr:hypothetical protein [Lentisphaerota bacterium]